jgi:glycosyltransferase involved in cell wall biosynthesis
MTNPLTSEIILIANVDSTFVRKDERLLSENSKVQKMICAQPKTVLRFLLEQIKIIGFVLKNIRASKAVVCWFADYHSYFPALLAKWFNKPFYLIQGGYDTTYLPDLYYGVFSNNIRSYMVDYAYQYATLNLPVSKFLAKEIRERYNNEIPIKVLPTGYSVEYTNHWDKEKSVLTVAGVDTQKRFLIKGLDRFIALAKEMPDIPFTIIGVEQSLLNSNNLPDNLIYRETLSKPEVDEYYKKAKVYCQFSIREGLPNAVFEAMSYECTVVGMNHSGIAEAVGNTGFLLDEWSVTSARQLVESALNDTRQGVEGRVRVMEYFNEDLRRRGLQEIINL